MLLEDGFVLHGIEVGIHNRRAVQLYRDVTALRRDLLTVPLAYRLLEPALRGYHFINRPVVLPGLQVLVLRSAVVEYLNLHAHVGRVTLERRADADTIVGVLRELE